MSNQALLFGVDVREDDTGGELADQIGCRRERLAEKGEEVTDGYTLCVSKLVLGFVVEVAPPGCDLHWWACIAGRPRLAKTVSTLFREARSAGFAQGELVGWLVQSARPNTIMRRDGG